MEFFRGQSKGSLEDHRELWAIKPWVGFLEHRGQAAHPQARPNGSHVFLPWSPSGMGRMPCLLVFLRSSHPQGSCECSDGHLFVLLGRGSCGKEWSGLVGREARWRWHCVPWGKYCEPVHQVVCRHYSKFSSRWVKEFPSCIGQDCLVEP